MESSILRTPKPDRVKRYDVTPSSTKKKRAAAGHDNQNASATPSKRSPCTPCNALRSPTHSAKQTHSDRFIPVRPESFEVARFNLLGAQNDENASNTTKSVTPLQSEYKRAMREALLDAARFFLVDDGVTSYRLTRSGLGVRRIDDSMVVCRARARAERVRARGVSARRRRARGEERT